MDELREERARLAVQDDLESRLRLPYLDRVLADHEDAGAAAASVIARATA